MDATNVGAALEHFLDWLGPAGNPNLKFRVHIQGAGILDRVSGDGSVGNDEVFDLATREALFIDKNEAPIGEDIQVSNDLERNLDGLVRQGNAVELLPRLIRRNSRSAT